MNKSKTPTKPMPISAVTGRIVTQQYADKHPKTTVVLQVPVRKPGNGK
jgi:hypothetical protein